MFRWWNVHSTKTGRSGWIDSAPGFKSGGVHGHGVPDEVSHGGVGVSVGGSRRVGVGVSVDTSGKVCVGGLVGMTVCAAGGVLVGVSEETVPTVGVSPAF